MNLTLTGKRAVVCGASQGIGFAAAAALSELGASVTLVARNGDALQKRRGELFVASGQSHDFIVADFEDTVAVAAAAATIAKRGSVHVLVNNTGGPKPGPAMQTDSPAFLDGFNRHLINNQTFVRAFVDGMKQDGYGRIVNVISTSVKEPIRGLGVSNTIRAAVAGWAKTLSVELAPFGITVNNVLPGATNTARLVEINERKSKDRGVPVAEIEREAIAEIPMGRYGDPTEIANVIAFLASPAASYVSGQSIAVDGGRMRSI